MMAAADSGNSTVTSPSTPSSPMESDGSSDLPPPPPPGTSAFPWLMFPEPASSSPITFVGRIFYHIPSGAARVHFVPGEASRRCVASAHGWLVLAAANTPRSITLLNPNSSGPGTRFDIHCPFGDQFIDRLHAVLTSSPMLDPECLLAVASDKTIAYCRPCAREPSTRRWRSLRAQGFLYDAAASDIVCVGTVVYLVDHGRNLWRVDLADPVPEVERRDTGFSLPDGERTRHHLVESLGVVHLVLSDEHHERVSLYTMDWDGGTWVPVDGSRCDFVLLLGRGCSAALPASDAAPNQEPGTVLFAHQPSTRVDAGAVGDDDDEEPEWFWSEARVHAAGQDELPVLKETAPHPPGDYTAGDSFWFFPAIDPDAGQSSGTA